MRDTILVGITNAMRDASHRSLSQALANLSSDDQQMLADSILAALGTLDADSPAPQVTDVAAGPALVFTPADVVAMFARESTDRALDALHLDEQGEGRDFATSAYPYISLVTWDADTDYKAFRQFAWAVAPMFGAVVRSTRVDGQPVWAIAATTGQAATMRRMWNTFRLAAQAAHVDQLSADEQAAFWATLGATVTDNDTARRLIEDNIAIREAARMRARDAWGATRTLARVSASDDAAIRDVVDSVMASASPAP